MDVMKYVGPRFPDDKLHAEIERCEGLLAENLEDYRAAIQERKLGADELRAFLSRDSVLTERLDRLRWQAGEIG